ncbi:MAG: hypothetical protein GWP19_00545 [Planctomycetia bacterium]|nr:hypothetical protein [Planctomycetia bacterium]
MKWIDVKEREPELHIKEKTPFFEFSESDKHIVIDEDEEISIAKISFENYFDDPCHSIWSWYQIVDDAVSRPLDVKYWCEIPKIPVIKRK